jgi:S-DNA-T family DNA segregation ATPase FtsK/SpoIIIE
MLYGVTQFFKSFLLGSFIIVSVFIALKYTLFDQIEDQIIYMIIGVYFIERLIYYIRYWKYIVMPYALNLSKRSKNENLSSDFFIDKFVAIKSIDQKTLQEKIFLKDHKQFELEYKNFIALDVENYKQAKDQIIHYLGLHDQRYEIKIIPHKRKGIKLKFYKLPFDFDMDLNMFKKDQIFLGLYDQGLYYKSIDSLDHMLVLGESGSGKSNLMQLINLNILINYHRFRKLYYVDLKGGVELQKFRSLGKDSFVSSIDQLNEILDQLVTELKDTQDQMIKDDVRKLTDYTVIFFDEFGAISSHNDKKVRDQIYDKLALISMQGRSSGILLFMFGQKIDTTILPNKITTNLQTNLVGKTSSDYNINTIDHKENIRSNITWVEVQDFNKGRFIYKDGLTSNKVLLQVPFVSDQFIDFFLSIDLLQLNSKLSKL